ncbi:MAG: hypothetical protein IPG22_06670 [Acidobacteria bacterium]|nr:hypothetical protein [Acidobacteriota bacterium]
MFGLLGNVSMEEMLTIASAVSIVGGLFNWSATLVSTSRIGLPPPPGDGVPGGDDGVRNGAVGDYGVRDTNPTDTLLDMDYK